MKFNGAYCIVKWNYSLWTYDIIDIIENLYKVGSADKINNFDVGTFLPSKPQKQLFCFWNP